MLLALCALAAALRFAPVEGAEGSSAAHAAYRTGTISAPESRAESVFDGEPLRLQAIDVGMTTAEPTVGIAPDGTAYFAGATLHVDVGVTAGIAQTHTLRSLDGGLTWERVQFHVPVVGTSLPPASFDPLVWVDPGTGRVFNLDLRNDCSWLNFSDDRGATWTANPMVCGVTGIHDHQSMTSGRAIADRRPLGYPDLLYYCVNMVVRTACSYSPDGGVVWLPTGGDAVPPTGDGLGCAKLTGQVQTTRDGFLLLPLGRCEDRPGIAVSEDGGRTWRRHLVSTARSEYTHTSVAADDAGNLYYVWIAALGTPEQVLPFLAVSRDDGRTWSEPMMIAPPGVKNANFPVVVAGSEGRVAVSFPGTASRSAGGRASWNQYVTVSTEALADDPLFVSSTANDPVTDPVHRGSCLGRCGGMWDFLDIKLSPAGEIWATAADDCTGDCDTGTARFDWAGRGIAIRQVGGPSLRVNQNG